MWILGEAQSQLELGPICEHVGVRRAGIPNPSFLLVATNLLLLQAPCCISLILRASLFVSWVAIS